MGYDEQSKAYRCYNSSTDMVVISRDVKFPLEKENNEFPTILQNDLESEAIVEIIKS